MTEGSKFRTDTLITHLGRDPEAYQGAVNTPVFHASTIVHQHLADFEDREKFSRQGAMVYGRIGTPTSFALEQAVAGLEGGHGAVSVSSGLAAITTALLALLKSGDHLLVTDSAYFPTRKFCDQMLVGLGIGTTYYDPLIGAGIESLIRPNTRVIFVEAPGSLTFEMQDVPEIAGVAKAAGLHVVMDSTWATPILFRPFEKGVDVSIQAGTKYIVGHSDAMLGTITATEELLPRIRQTARLLGQCAGPDDLYLSLRGLRTLSVRLARHQETGLKLARWLDDRPEVDRVLHPALPSDPGHAIWQRDFSGACGLFSIVLDRPYPQEALSAMVDGLELFGIGASWGGYESLVMPGHPERIRTATRWEAPGPLLRFHAGLEDCEDLIADLAAGFERLAAA